MKCKKCGFKNVTQAKYCYKCGNSFTKEEHNEAVSKSIITKITKLKDLYDTVTLSKITGSIYFKIATILLVLAIGIYSMFKNGSDFHVLDGDNYTYKYNEKLNEYYLYLDDRETSLNLYLPHEINTFYVTYYDKDNNLLEKNTYYNLDDIKVKVEDTDNYYKISYEETENSQNTIKLYTYLKESVRDE